MTNVQKPIMYGHIYSHSTQPAAVWKLRLWGGGGEISVHGNPVAMFRSLRKEGEETGGQLFVVGSVIVRYPSKVQKQATFLYEHSSYLVERTSLSRTAVLT